MSEVAAAPFIGPAEQALFDIEDSRDRADQLKKKLTPKLANLLQRASARIKQVYGERSLDPYRISLIPANRPRARETKEYEAASAGLSVKNDHWYFQQRIECTSNHIVVKVFGHRGNEANRIIAVLRKHEQEATRILDHVGCWLDTKQVSDDFFDDSYTIQRLITKLTMFPERDWRGGVTLEGPDDELPLQDGFSTPAVYEFVAMFPVFRAATDVFLGREDRFLTYARQFWEWDATVQYDEEEEPSGTTSVTQPDDPGKLDQAEGDVYRDLDAPLLTSAIEGQAVQRLVTHRRRERRLRDAKIEQAGREGGGRLTCQVRGCGFDFLAVYGEIGRDFAIVHHTNPLSDPTREDETRIEDLAIVCANCHAMIHRKNRCLAMETLIPSRPPLKS